MENKLEIKEFELAEYKLENTTFKLLVNLWDIFTMSRSNNIESRVWNRRTRFKNTVKNANEMAEDIYDVLNKYKIKEKGSEADFFDIVFNIEKDLNKIPDFNKYKTNKITAYLGTKNGDTWTMFKKLGYKKYKSMKELMNAINA